LVCNLVKVVEVKVKVKVVFLKACELNACASEAGIYLIV
jgi:hypothetical protein